MGWEQYWPTICQMAQRDQLDLLLVHLSQTEKQYSQIEKMVFHVYLMQMH